MAQKWDSEKYSQQAVFVSKLGLPVFDLLAPQHNETILDLGCGDGTLAQKLTVLGCDVTGVDTSESMVSAARKKGIKAFCQSGEQLTFNDEFDAVFSNAALHWMKDYHAVLKGVVASLHSNGRFVGEFGGFGNIASIAEAIKSVYQQTFQLDEYQSPWFFPSAQKYQIILEGHGFVVDYIELIDRPTPLDSGISAWLKTFANHATSSMDKIAKDHFLTQVEKLLKPKLYSEKNGWVADYVRLRFCARKAL